MKIKIRLNTDSYIINGKVTNIIERVREKENYDLVEIECDDWKEIRQVSFKGKVSIPMEIEDDEIIFLKVESIKNEEEKIERDIEEMNNIFKLAHKRTITYEVEDIITRMKEMFDYEIRNLNKGVCNVRKRMGKIYGRI